MAGLREERGVREGELEKWEGLVRAHLKSKFAAAEPWLAQGTRLAR